VTASSAHLADGVDASTVTIVLSEADSAVGGLRSDDFSVEVTGNANCGNVSETATAGTYALQVTNTTAETVTVTVAVGSVMLAQEPRIVFEAGPPDARGSTLSATSPHRANGLDASTVTVTLLDANGNAVTGLAGSELAIALTGSASTSNLRETATPGTYELHMTSLVPGTVTVAVTGREAALTERAVVVFESPVMDERLVHDSFVDVTRSFLFRRMDRMLALEPQSYRLTNRLSRFGYGSGLTLHGRGTVDRLEGSMAASLRGLQSSIAAVGALMEPGAKAGKGPAQVSASDAFDIWAEGQFSLYKDTAGKGAQRGSFGILYAGADYCFGRRLLIGVMGQFDWTTDRSSGLGSTLTGNGWMVGPYLSLRLGKSLHLDWRAAWGRSSNRASIDIAGGDSPYMGTFASERWLMRATLSGTWNVAALQMTPEVSLAYLQERQDEFTASDGDAGVAVDAQRLLVGRLVLKPSFTYPIRLGDTALLPYARPQLIWDFRRAGVLALDGQLATQDTPRGAAEFGLRIGSRRHGVSGGVSITYDGIGQKDFEAVTVSLGLAFAF
jgi:hypothetical protein